MVGIKLVGTGELSANDMYQEFKWVNTNGNIFLRPQTGAIPYRSDTLTLSNAANISIAGAAPYTIYDQNQLSLVKVEIDNTVVEVLLPYADNYVGVVPALIPELTTSPSFLLFDYIDQQFWLYQWGALVTVTGTVRITYNYHGSDVAMSNYNRTSLTLGGVVPMNPYNGNVGELLLDQAYNDYYGARRNLTIMDTRIDIPNAGPFGGCAAAGFSGVSFYIKRIGRSFIKYNSIYGRGGSLSNGTFLMFDSSTMYDSRTGWVRDQWYSQQDVLTGITDPVSFKLEFRGLVGQGSIPHNYQVKITADCKGGGRGFTHLAKDWTDLNTFQDVLLSDVSAPATVAVNQRYNMTVSGGFPNETVVYTQNGLYPIVITLNASGSYTFSNIYLNAPGTYTYEFTFQNSGYKRIVTTVAS